MYCIDLCEDDSSDSDSDPDVSDKKLPAKLSSSSTSMASKRIAKASMHAPKMINLCEDSDSDPDVSDKKLPEKRSSSSTSMSMASQSSMRSQLITEVSTAASRKRRVPDPDDDDDVESTSQLETLVSGIQQKLQEFANHGKHITKIVKLGATLSTKVCTFGREQVRVPVLSQDLPELINAIENDQDFAKFVAHLRSDVDYHTHLTESVEDDIHYELANLLAPPLLKTSFRIVVYLKCPKHEVLANGENLETGGSNDPVLRRKCASVIGAETIESALPHTSIQRGNGSTIKWKNSRIFCIKDPAPGSCGCLDWQLLEVLRAIRESTGNGEYWKAKNIPCTAISFGGDSAKQVVRGLPSHLFPYRNSNHAPHVCTLSLHYGYPDIPAQLKSIRKKVKSISDTLDMLWRDVQAQHADFNPPAPLWESLSRSENTPMVAEPTLANIEAARKADSRSRSIRMKDLWQTTTFREMMLKRRWSQKQRQALSDRMKALWTDESWRTKCMGKR